MTPTRTRIEEFLKLAASASPGPWIEVFRRGNRIVTEREDDDESFHDLIARVSGIPATATFIAASRTEGPYFAEKLLEAIGVLTNIAQAEHPDSFCQAQSSCARQFLKDLDP